MPSAFARTAIAAPIAPSPTSPSVPPASEPIAGDCSHITACAHSCARCASRARWSLRVNASIIASACSAMASAWRPFALVTITSLATSSGKSTPVTLAAVEWIQRSRRARAKFAGRTAKPSTTSASGSSASASSRVAGQSTFT